MSARSEKNNDGVHLTLQQIESKLGNGGWDDAADVVIKDLVRCVKESMALNEAVLGLLETLEREQANGKLA